VMLLLNHLQENAFEAEARRRAAVVLHFQ